MFAFLLCVSLLFPGIVAYFWARNRTRALICLLPPAGMLVWSLWLLRLEGPGFPSLCFLFSLLSCLGVPLAWKLHSAIHPQIAGAEQIGLSPEQRP